MRTFSVSLLLALLSALTGCDDSPSEAFSLSFAASVGDQDFTCGQRYTGLGTSSDQALTVRELRLFVHDVRLVTASGDEVSLELDENGVTQTADVAYLDFVDGSTSGCEGDAATRFQVDGMAPAGDYVGVRFRVGVPFEQNHQDASIAEAPLNLSAMFWAWQSGYKFIRIDGETDGLPAWRFHLGSTGCEGDATAGGVTSCAAPNRPEIELMDFDPTSDAILLDLDALLSEVDLDTQTVDTPPGCMAGATDPDCAPYFQALGLPFGGDAGVARAFRVAEGVR